jgi:hypothetical protein
VANLRAAHGADPGTVMGVDILTGGPGDMQQLGINESFRVKQQVGGAGYGGQGGGACGARGQALETG